MITSDESPHVQRRVRVNTGNQRVAESAGGKFVSDLYQGITVTVPIAKGTSVCALAEAIVEDSQGALRNGRH